jgi:hypothetical protein
VRYRITPSREIFGPGKSVGAPKRALLACVSVLEVRWKSSCPDENLPREKHRQPAPGGSHPARVAKIAISVIFVIYLLAALEMD